MGYDQQGNLIVAYYTPASRYWSDDGVFCSADCSFKDHMEKINANKLSNERESDSSIQPV
jgi:hypothetical protein